MSLEEELSAQASAKDTILTIGVFDGVHLGHKELLAEVKRQAKSLGCLSAVVTFRQHPDELVHTGKVLPHLTSLEERINRLQAEGIDKIIVLSFSRDIVEIEAREFITLLVQYLKMKALVIGPDFALGKNRKGDAKYLRELGTEMGFTVMTVPPKVVNGETVSSTAIRKALAAGDMQHVFNLQGQYFSFAGPVVTGFGRGKKIGYPTANLDVDRKQALPPNGVYATLTSVEGRIYRSLTSIGVRPTFDGGRRTIETFILDYSGDLYGKIIKIEFIERLRAEKKFASVEELKKQIEEDVKLGRDLLNKLKQ